MNCPYSDPSCSRELPPDAAACPVCKRFVKACGSCGMANRAFANFCRACAEPFGAGESWTGFKGGVRRLGSHAVYRQGGYDIETIDSAVSLRLGSACRSLLGCDGHLIAVGQSGVVDVTDPHRPEATQRIQCPGPVTVEPCIDRGVLYVGSRGEVAAYSLGTLTWAQPKTRRLWRIALSGTPIQALTPLGDALFVTVASEAQKEVQIIENVRSAQPSAARTIAAAPRVSWLAADPSAGLASFLSETDRGVSVHLARPAYAQPSCAGVALGPFAEHPIAFLGGRVFAVFEDTRLYRLDPKSGEVDETLDDDTQLFSLTAEGDDGWDPDVVRVDGSGVVFGRSGVKDAFSHLDRAVKGSPVIAGGRAAAVGLEDGRVLLYDLHRPPRHEVWRLDGATGAPITALAAFDSFIAAGNRDGVVGVREIRAAAGAS